jgi:hypothetical protein
MELSNFSLHTYLFIFCFRNEKHLQVNNNEFERVGEFKYLGSLITESNDNNTEIKARIMAENKSYYSVLPLLRSKAVSRTTKIRMYKTIIWPVVLYGSEVWCLTVPVVLYSSSGAVWIRSVVFNGTSGAVWYQWCCMDQKCGV